mmetsp:Transcript_819/g.2988  ORF Transcript_819/g.2988 Transcript_819/m.2988 type:complete len:322 (-) Transcript_819:45-1010(-)
MNALRGWTKLHGLCLDGCAADLDEGMVKLVHAATTSGNTPMHFACARPGARRIATRLLAMGGSILAPNTKGQTPLHCAAAHFSPGDVDSLLSTSKPQIIDVADEGGCTPLHWAIQQSMTPLATSVALLCAGASANRPDGNGDTALHYAAREGRYNLFEMLVDAGGDIDARNHRGVAPIHVAIEADDEDFVRAYLHANMEDPPVTTRSKSTLLHVAARNGSQSVAQALLDILGHTTVDVPDKYGQTALVVAVANKNFGIADKLQRVGANVPNNCKALLRIAVDIIAAFESDSDSDYDSDSDMWASDDDLPSYTSRGSLITAA